LAKDFSVGKFSFAKQEDLENYLGISEGVTHFGLINDVDHIVNVAVQDGLFDCDQITFHPLISNELIAISSEDFKLFVNTCGNKLKIFDI